MKTIWLLFFVGCTSIFQPKLLIGYSIDTTTGADLNKAIVQTTEFVLTSTDVVRGTVELLGGLRVARYGGLSAGTLATNLPVGNYLRFWNFAPILRLGRSVTFD